MSEHALLPPSSAEQWGNCGGWYQATRDLPNPESAETVKGTAGHWVYSECFEADASPDELLGAVAPNGYVVDEDCVEAARIMLDDIRYVLERFPDMLVVCEQRLKMERVHPVHSWGHCDFGGYSPSKRVLVVSDLKTGHRQHTAKGHKQMLLYGEGLADFFGIDGHMEQSIRIQIRVVQPYSYRAEGVVDVWTGFLSDLRADINLLAAKAEENLTANPRLSSGKWCRDCAAISTCPAARFAGYNMIDVVHLPFGIDAMNSRDLYTEYQLIDDGMKLIEARRDALKAELEHRVKNGDTSAGLCLENGSHGALKWNCSKQEAIALAQQFGVDISYTDVISPSQAKKLVPAQNRLIFEEVLKNFTRRQIGSVQLLPVDKTLSGRAFSRRDEDANV